MKQRQIAIKAKIQTAFSQVAPKARHIATFLHKNPETAFQEFKACSLLSDILESSGFKVTRKIGGIATAFKAVYGTKTGKAIALLAEYDALPKLGHGCGHNLIAAASIGAALAISQAFPPHEVKISVVGTPAEETQGGKIKLLKAGEFSDIAVALMAHPSTENRLHASSLALVNLLVNYYGRLAHASASPEEGINALDALIHLFNSLGSLRALLPPQCRVDGIITKGGTVPNLIPDHTQAFFYLRAPTLKLLHLVRKRFSLHIRGASVASGARPRVTQVGPLYLPFISNKTVGEIFSAFSSAFGIKMEKEKRTSRLGSSDLGNISQSLPCLHPTFAITTRNGEHTAEFAQAAISEEGIKKMLKIAQALACTAALLNLKPELVKKAKAELNRELKKGNSRTLE